MENKQEIVKGITAFVSNNPEGKINGNPVHRIYLRYKNVIYTLIEVTPNGETNFVGNDAVGGEFVIKSVAAFPTLILDNVLGELNDKLEHEAETDDAYKVVKKRAYEVAEEMKKRIEPLIERAFMTSTFDIDEAYKNGYAIPKAIMVAVFKTIADEFSGNFHEFYEEVDNIYRSL